jgi:hypothetical protein
MVSVDVGWSWVGCGFRVLGTRDDSAARATHLQSNGKHSVAYCSRAAKHRATARDVLSQEWI